MPRLSSREIVLKANVIDNASSRLNQIGGNIRNLERMSNSFKFFGFGMAATAIGRGLTTIGQKLLGVSKQAIQMQMDFTSQMHLVQTQAQIPQRQFAALTKGALNMSSKVGVATSDVSAGLYDVFSSMEVNYRQALKIVKGASKAAIGGGTDTRTALRAVVSELNAFGLPVSKLNYLLDNQFQLVRKGIGDYSSFASAIYNLLPGAKQYNQSIQTITGEWAAMTRAGQTASQGSISVARAMDQLFRTSNADKLKKTLGIDVFDKATGKYKQMPVIIQAMIDKFKGLSEKQVQAKFFDIFGAGEIRANRFFRTALLRFPLIHKMIGFMGTKQVAGQAQKAFNIMDKTPTRQWFRFTNELKNFAITVANTVMPAVNTLFHWLRRMGAWLDNLSPSTKHMIAMFVLFGGAIALISGKVLTAVGRFSFLISILKFTGLSFSGTTLLIFGIIAAISALVIGGYFLIKNWSKVKEWWSRNWHTIKTIAVVAIGIISGLIVGKLVASFDTFIFATVPRLISGFGMMLTSVKVFFGNLAATIAANPFAVLAGLVAAAVIIIIMNWGKVKNFFIDTANWFIRWVVNPFIHGINAIIDAINILPFVNIPTIHTMQQLKLSSDKASGGFDNLRTHVKLYGDAVFRADHNTKAFAQNLKDFPKIARHYIHQIAQSGHASIDLAKAQYIAQHGQGIYNRRTMIQARVIAEAVAIIRKHVSAVLTNKRASHDWALTISTLNNLHLRQRTHLAGVINHIFGMGGALTHSQSKLLMNVHGTKSFHAALQMLNRVLKQTESALGATGVRAAGIRKHIQQLTAELKKTDSAAEASRLKAKIAALQEALKGVTGPKKLNLSDNLIKVRHGWQTLAGFVDTWTKKPHKLHITDNISQVKRRLGGLDSYLNFVLGGTGLGRGHRGHGGHGGGRQFGGAVYRDRAYWVGKHDSELFIPGTHGSIVSAKTLAMMLSDKKSWGRGGDRGTTNIFIQPRKASSDAKDIVREFEWYARTRGF